MKTAVIITLIVAGVVVVAIPPLSDAWRTLMLTQLLEHGASSVTLGGGLGDLYIFGCYLLGAGMVIVGVTSAFVPVGDGRSSELSVSAG